MTTILLLHKSVTSDIALDNHACTSSVLELALFLNIENMMDEVRTLLPITTTCCKNINSIDLSFFRPKMYDQEPMLHLRTLTQNLVGFCPMASTKKLLNTPILKQLAKYRKFLVRCLLKKVKSFNPNPGKSRSYPVIANVHPLTSCGRPSKAITIQRQNT